MGPAQRRQCPRSMTLSCSAQAFLGASCIVPVVPSQSCLLCSNSPVSSWHLTLLAESGKGLRRAQVMFCILECWTTHENCSYKCTEIHSPSPFLHTALTSCSIPNKINEAVFLVVDVLQPMHPPGRSTPPPAPPQWHPGATPKTPGSLNIPLPCPAPCWLLNWGQALLQGVWAPCAAWRSFYPPAEPLCSSPPTNHLHRTWNNSMSFETPCFCQICSRDWWVQKLHLGEER